MQGSLTLVRFPIRAIATMLVASAILLLGALGGYWIRSQTATPVSAGSAQTVVVPGNPGASYEGTHRSGTQ